MELQGHKPAISFHFLKKAPALKRRNHLKQFVATIFSKEKKGLEMLTIIFCSDDYLLSINQQFLGHDYYTDIITFELSETKKTLGEIYISLDRVRDNASLLKVSFTSELLRVVFHGALHLCGYKDKTTRDAGLMRKMEDKYLELYKTYKPVPRGTSK